MLLRLPQPRLSASVNSSSARLARCIGTLSSRPSSVASHVLVRQAQREGRRVVFVRQELVDQPVEAAPPAAGALPHRLPQRQRLDPGLDAHREDLGEAALHRIAGAIVHQLRDRAGADRADIAGLVADRVEHLLVPVEDLLVAADPQRQLAATRRRAGPPLTGASSM